MADEGRDHRAFAETFTARFDKDAVLALGRRIGATSLRGLDG
jgi:hypothetical protein